MPLLAQELHDRPGGYSWSLKRTRAGFEGRKWYFVATDEEREALLAENLPKIGDPWDNSEELRLCVCTEVGPTERMGAYTYVAANFQSLSSVGGGGNEPPRPQSHLDAWCAVRTSLETQPILLPVDENGETVTDADLILNGEGTTRPAVVVDYLVSVAYDLSRGDPDLDRFDGLGDPCHTNRDPVTFPPILRTRARRTKAPGECLYKGYEVSQDGELLVVTHTIAVRAGGMLSWRFFYEGLNEQGDVISTQFARVAPSANWSGLFQ